MDVNEAKFSVNSLGLGLCTTQLLNELFVNMKIYSIIKRYKSV
jgi:hypothetical protein